jgi:hypothetical protein
MDEQAATASGATGPRDDEPLRQQVLHILEQHPAGLTPGEIASQLALTTSLTHLLPGRADGYPSGPPQTRTCAMNACGSSGRASATRGYCPGGVW